MHLTNCDKVCQGLGSQGQTRILKCEQRNAQQITYCFVHDLAQEDQADKIVMSTPLFIIF